MQLCDENKEIINKLELYIENLSLSELEATIKGNIEENISLYSEKIYDAYNRLLQIKNRIYAVNNKVICNNEELKNWFFRIDSMCMLPCGIAYMDMPLNNRRYLVQNFYKELDEKYAKEPINCILLGMIPNSSGRFLKIEQLEESEKKTALVLDDYLKLCSICEQLEMLINFVKCIQYNYADDK